MQDICAISFSGALERACYNNMTMNRATIRAVADRAGVSTMTVSRVLRGDGGSKYSQQVLAAARELGYVPVRSALQNRHVKTRIIGVLLEEPFVFDNPIGFETLSGISQGAFEAGYDLLLLQPKQHRPLEEQKMQVLDRRCDGFIFVVPHERPEVLELLIESSFPAVTCYTTDVPPGVHSVVPDNVTAIRQAVELLYGQGHRRIAMWSGPLRNSDARERKAAYEEVMQGAGLEAFAEDFDELLRPLNVLAALDVLLNRQITAVICHNDARALALWDAVTARGLRVPEDLSLIGVDNIGTEADERGLTTFINPFRMIGREAVATAINLLQGSSMSKPCKRLSMPLVQRSSVAPPRTIELNT
jgi:LacI family transcriptional regulator